MRRTTLYIYLSFFSYLFSIAQSRPIEEVKEVIQLHLNSSTLITGELLRYAAYCKDEHTGRLSKLSKYMYIELIGKQGVLAQQKIPLADGRGFGSFFISSLIPSGRYQLLAYTRWMRNFSTICRKEINVVNPFEKYPTMTEVSPLRDNLNSDEMKLEDTIALRQKVTITKVVPPGHYSVSVRRRADWLSGAVPQSLQQVDLQATTNKLGGYLGDLRFIPEYREELLTGQLLDDQKEPLANIAIAIAIQSQPSQLRFSKTDSGGRFILPYVSSFANHESLVMTYPVGSGGSIQVDSPFLDNYPSFDYTPRPLSNSLIKEVEDLAISIQIQNAVDSASVDNRETLWLPQFAYDYTYLLDDYTRFSTLPETILEYIPTVGLRKRQDELIKAYSSQDLDRERNPALILLDGIPVNEQKILEFSPFKIGEIRVMNKQYYLGSLVFDGVVNFISKEDQQQYFDFGNDYHEVELMPLSRDDAYSFAGHDPSNRLPDQRHELYWNPSLSVNDEEEVAISFFSSDVEGLYELSIQGLTSEGIPFSSSTILRME